MFMAKWIEFITTAHIWMPYAIQPSSYICNRCNNKGDIDKGVIKVNMNPNSNKPQVHAIEAQELEISAR